MCALTHSHTRTRTQTGRITKSQLVVAGKGTKLMKNQFEYPCFSSSSCATETRDTCSRKATDCAFRIHTSNAQHTSHRDHPKTPSKKKITNKVSERNSWLHRFIAQNIIIFLSFLIEHMESSEIRCFFAFDTRHVSLFYRSWSTSILPGPSNELQITERVEVAFYLWTKLSKYWIQCSRRSESR